MNLEDEIKKINLRLEKIESRLGIQSSQESSKQASQEATPPTSVGATGVSVQSVAPRAKEPWTHNLELLLGGNILGKLGLVALVLGAGWFIKYAFDKEWVNESGRIIVGLIVASSLSGFGLYLAKRAMRILPHAILGSGFAIYYVSIFSAYYFYNLIGREETFVLLAGLSILILYLSKLADSEALYTFSLFGSFLAPILVSTGENRYVFLFTYAILLQIGFLYVTWNRHWRVAPYLSLLFQMILYTVWASDKVSASRPYVPTAYLFLLFASFLVHQLRNAFSQKRTSLSIIWVLLISNIFSLIAILITLKIHNIDWSAYLSLASAASLLITYYVVQRSSVSIEGVAALKAMLGLLFLGNLGISITDFTEGNWMALGWILLAGTLSVFASYYKSPEIILVSVFFWAFALVRLLFVDRPIPYIAFINTRFALYSVAAFLLALTYVFQRKNPIHTLMQTFAYSAIVVSLWGAFLECSDSITTKEYRILSYSYTMAIYSAVLLTLGFWKGIKMFRNTGIILAAIVVAKLYVYDIWIMGKLVRIIALLSLGVALLALSVFYQKFKDKLFSTSKSLLIFALVGAAFSTQLRAEGFRAGSYKFYKELQSPNNVKGADYGRFILDLDVVKNAGIDDLRVVQNNKEIPFFIRSKAREQMSRAFSVVPETVVTENERGSGTTIIRLPEPPEGYEYSEIQIACPPNYEGMVSVSPAKDAGEYLTSEFKNIVGYENICRIEIRGGQNRFFKVVSDKYRLDVTSVLAKPSFEFQEMKFDLLAEGIDKDENVDLQAMVYYFQNPDKKAISRLELSFEDTKYDRQVEIAYLDPFDKSYREIARASIESTHGKIHRVDLPYPTSSPLRISTYHYDDAPLKLNGLVGYSTVQELVFRLPEDLSGIRLYYGNRYARTPVYDIFSTIDSSPKFQTFNLKNENANAEFSYSVIEPPISSWLIRGFYILGLLLVVIFAIPILKHYAKELSGAGK